MTQNATVRLSGGLVVSVRDRVPEAECAEEGVEEVDLEGKYMLPGIWDCHVHLGAV